MSKKEFNRNVTVNIPDRVEYENVRLLPREVHEAFRRMREDVEKVENKNTTNEVALNAKDVIESETNSTPKEFTAVWEKLSEKRDPSGYTEDIAEYLVKPLMAILGVKTSKLVDDIVDNFEYTGVQLSRYWSMLTSATNVNQFNAMVADIVNEINELKKDGFNELSDVDKVERIFKFSLHVAA